MRRSALLVVGAALGCASPTGGVAAPRTWTLPTAARIEREAGRGVASGEPVVVRAQPPRDGALRARDALVEALRGGDEAAFAALLHEVVEGTEGERVAGRAQLVARLRGWQTMLAQGPGGSASLTARLFAREECQPSTCGGVFLREGDWFVTLEYPSLPRMAQVARMRVRGLGPNGGALPPRYFVLRAVAGELRVVAVNDDLLETP
ncbi:MAG: hypothetical protein U0325_24485 [Polyangiales bacterium]